MNTQRKNETEALEALYVLARRGRLDALKALCRIEKLPDDLLEVAKREGYYCERVDESARGIALRSRAGLTPAEEVGVCIFPPRWRGPRVTWGRWSKKNAT